MYEPITASKYGPFLPAYMAAHTWAITALVQIRYKAWRFLTAFLIVLIFVPLNGGYIRAYMGHMGAAMGHTWAHIWATWEQNWGIHGRIHRPYGGSNGACMRAYIGHI